NLRLFKETIHPMESESTALGKGDFYEILGVSRTASDEEIEIAFHGLQHKLHENGKPKTIDDVERLRQVVRAYNVLKDPEQRRRYDHLGWIGDAETKTSPGYDLEQIQTQGKALDMQLRASRIRWTIWDILRLF